MKERCISSDVVEKIDFLLEKSGYSRRYLASQVDINPSTFTKWKKNITTIAIPTLWKVADFFNLPIEYFIYKDYRKNDDFDILYTKYSKLSIEKKEMVRIMIDSLSMEVKEK